MEQLTIDTIIEDTNNLDNLIAEYYDIKAQKDALDEKLKAKNKEIVALLEKKGETKYKNDNYTTSLSYKTSFKYKDEIELIRRLISDYNMGEYVVEKVDTTKFNDQLKKSPSFKELFNDMIDETISSSLSVKKN